MIQDIAPHHFDNAYRPAPPSPDSYALCFRNEEPCCFAKKMDPLTSPVSGIWKRKTKIFTRTVPTSSQLTVRLFICSRTSAFRRPPASPWKISSFSAAPLPATWLLPGSQGISFPSGMKAAAGADDAVLPSSMMRRRE